MPYKYLLPDISEKQKEIVDLVSAFRFINRWQLQRLFGHKDPRRMNAWLKDLVAKGYLGRIYSHKLLENTKPAIYYLANNGISYVKHYKEDVAYLNNGHSLETAQVKKFYHDKQASQTFIAHCITIAELYVLLKIHEKEINSSPAIAKTYAYDVQTKTELWIEKHIAKKLEETKEYIPDLYFEKAVETTKTLNTQSFFVLLFDVHVPRYALRYTVDKYMQLFEQTDRFTWYSGLDNRFPIILLILPTEQKCTFLKRYITEQLQWDDQYKDLMFLLTTVDKAVKHGLTGEIWTHVT